MRARPLLLATVVGLLSACEQAPVPSPAPRAEFIIAAADSVFWVRSDEDGIRVRGAPMVLAQVGGRFAELFLTDDDFSFYDAVYVGHRLYKRDLISGDSVQLYADTLMPLLARAYAAVNPDERPLSADEQGSENPRTIATADLMVLDVHGPWLSYEYHTDADVIGGVSSHGARRGVIDLRTGALATLDGMFGAPSARRLATEGRERWRMMRDSLRQLEERDGRGAGDELDRLAFDPRSFVLGVVDRAPRLRFAVVQSNAAVATGVMELDPIVLDEPAWWPEVRESRPVEEYIQERAWPRDGFTLVGRNADTPMARVAFALRDDAGTEWKLGSLPSPVLRVMWLGDSTDAPGTRAALTRAFNEAAFYSQDTRIVRHELRAPPPAVSVRNVSRVRPPAPAPRRAMASPTRLRAATAPSPPVHRTGAR